MYLILILIFSSKVNVLLNSWLGEYEQDSQICHTILLIKRKLIGGLGLGDVCTFQKNSYFNFLVNFLLTHFGNRKLRIKNDTIVNKNTITTL